MNPSACSLPDTRRRTPRRFRDRLELLNDLLVFWDCCAGLALGYLTDIAYLRLMWRVGFSLSPPPAMLHEMVLCSVVAALILREPRLASDRRLLTLPGLLGMLLLRGGLALGVLLMAGFVTGALGHLARLWLTGWLACFGLWILLSRLPYIAWAAWLQNRGALRETVVVVGVGGAAERLAARLGDAAEVLAVRSSANRVTARVKEQPTSS